jgi:hypothetical protein
VCQNYKTFNTGLIAVLYAKERATHITSSHTWTSLRCINIFEYILRDSNTQIERKKGEDAEDTSDWITKKF